MKNAIAWRLLKQVIAGWHTHKNSRLAAAIAYYAMFSLAPLLVIAVAVAGAIFGEAAAKGELAQRISNLVGSDAALVLEGMIEGAGQFRSGLFAWVLGAVALLIGATGVFAAVSDALATIWGLPLKGGVRDIVRTRIVSFLVVLAIGVLLLTFLIASTTLSVVARITGSFPALYQLLDILNLLFSFAVITCFVALVYKLLITVKLQWSRVWTGAAFTSLLFAAGKLLLGLYFASSRMRSVYGAASSVIVLLFWIYFSTLVFLLGAEFIRAWSDLDGDNSGLDTE